MSAPIASLPDWLLAILRPTVAPAPGSVRRVSPFAGDSIADWFTATRSWNDVLTDWSRVRGNGDEDGSRWKHPTASAPWSATIKHGCLFVYSGNTPFDQTIAGERHGYTKFRAWAVLKHSGDLSAAARAARELRRAA